MKVNVMHFLSNHILNQNNLFPFPENMTEDDNNKIIRCPDIPLKGTFNKISK